MSPSKCLYFVIHTRVEINWQKEKCPLWKRDVCFVELRLDSCFVVETIYCWVEKRPQSAAEASGVSPSGAIAWFTAPQV